jgi:2-oxoglutarate ferredoxin oxidoreductase subunit delta
MLTVSNDEKKTETSNLHLCKEIIKYGDPPGKVLCFLKARLESGTDKLVIAEGWCKRCGLCVSFCPLKALHMAKDDVPKVDNGRCVSCKTCELLCPDFAIIVK